MVSTLGVNTPAKVPNVPVAVTLSFAVGLAMGGGSLSLRRRNYPVKDKLMISIIPMPVNKSTREHHAIPLGKHAKAIKFLTKRST
ncbi:hypothetical protein DSCO28_42050 [Desulfosarcina ovata subsp. sediminis]|uniref:Uncharacterized protein n=1 Tax=Desulfosarcina ovata subsp. sediminis TaxID=885957 RepID=A0A5K7ZTU8_9BACT|nr:hypothetical protein DSCO28_42050 [Desulfosarcina ovata subsp. sediminis]